MIFHCGTYQRVLLTLMCACTFRSAVGLMRGGVYISDLPRKRGWRQPVPEAYICTRVIVDVAAAAAASAFAFSSASRRTFSSSAFRGAASASCRAASSASRFAFSSASRLVTSKVEAAAIAVPANDELPEYFVKWPNLTVVNLWIHVCAWNWHSLHLRVWEMSNSTSNPVFIFGSRATGPQNRKFWHLESTF